MRWFVEELSREYNLNQSEWVNMVKTFGCFFFFLLSQFPVFFSMFSVLFPFLGYASIFSFNSFKSSHVTVQIFKLIWTFMCEIIYAGIDLIIKHCYDYEDLITRINYKWVQKTRMEYIFRKILCGYQRLDLSQQYLWLEELTILIIPFLLNFQVTHLLLQSLFFLKSNRLKLMEIILRLCFNFV